MIEENESCVPVTIVRSPGIETDDVIHLQDVAAMPEPIQEAAILHFENSRLVFRVKHIAFPSWPRPTVCFAFDTGYKSNT